MSSLLRTFRPLAVGALAVLAISCADSPTGPRRGTPFGAIRLSDTLFTRSAVIRAGIDVPAGYGLRSGSVRWIVTSGTATVSEVAGASDSVDVSLTATGGVTLRATYTLTSVSAASTMSLAGPSLRVAGDVGMETTRSITVAAPRLEYGVLPTGSITAGQTLGGVRVDILDAAGRLMSNATDSVIIALDPTSGTAGATLFGTAGARAVAGRATFAGLSLQRAGTGYRLIASSPTITVRDTATTAVVAAAPSAATTTLTVADTVRSVSQTTTVTVTVRDQYGNPVLNATPSSIAVTASIGTLGGFTCTSGVCSATYTGTTLGTATITGTIGGTPIPTTTTVRVTAGAAANLVIAGDSTQVAGTTQNITITARDANGNVATSYTGVKSLTFSGASVSPALVDPTMASTAFGTATSITFSNGVANASMVLVTAETAVVATTDGTISAAGADRLTVVVSADNASPVVSDLQPSPATITADGVTTSVLTLQLKDSYGNPTTNVASPGTVEIVQTAGTGTLVADFTNIGGGSYTQTVTSAAAAGSGTFKVRLNGTIGTPQAVVAYVAAGGPLSRVVCTVSQAAAQSAASNTTVQLCAATAPGDLEIVTLALDGVDDIVAPTGVNDGTWVKISSTLQTTGSGGNKPMLLVLYARRYVAGNSRTVTFTAATNHKWSVDMITFRSSGSDTPGTSDIVVSQNGTGAGLSSQGLTAPEANTVVYYVMASSLTGNVATPTPDGLTVLGNNNTGGTSSASFMENLVTAGDVAPARTWVNTKTANAVLIQIRVHP